MARKQNYASMYTLRKDGRYMATYSDKAGNRKYVYDRDPEKLHQKMLRLTSTEETPPTFQEIAEAWEREHREEIEDKTWINYKKHYDEIIDRHGQKQMQEVTAQDVINHLTAAKAKDYSATVVNTIRSLYRMIFDYAIAHDYAQFNPVVSVRLPKGLKRGKRTAPTDKQIKTILQNMDKPFGLFPAFLLCTGLRKSEALALTWEDVDLKKKTISITKSLDYTSGANPKVKPPKTEAGNRIVPIIDMIHGPLQEAKKASKSAYLFPQQPSTRGGKGGGIMTLRGYEGAWERYCESVGLMGEDGKPELTAHNLRHGTATLMFELGVDEMTAQKILGHSRIEITREIYTELRDTQNAKSVKKFNDGMQEYMAPKKVRVVKKSCQNLKRG